MHSVFELIRIYGSDFLPPLFVPKTRKKLNRPQRNLLAAEIYLGQVKYRLIRPVRVGALTRSGEDGWHFLP